MTTAAPQIKDLTPRTCEEMKRESCLSLAADLIERGLQSPLDDMHLLLLQVSDSELIAKGDFLRSSLDKLCADAERLCGQARKVFPNSRLGAADYLRRKCLSLVQETNFYRQEQFWTKHDRASLLQAEDLITEMFRLYAAAEWLILNIDSEQPDYRIARRCRAPERTANPYEDIFGLRAATHHHD